MSQKVRVWILGKRKPVQCVTYSPSLTDSECWFSSMLMMIFPQFYQVFYSLQPNHSIFPKYSRNYLQIVVCECTCFLAKNWMTENHFGPLFLCVFKKIYIFMHIHRHISCLQVCSRCQDRNFPISLCKQIGLLPKCRSVLLKYFFVLFLFSVWQVGRNTKEGELWQGLQSSPSHFTNI